MDAVVIDRSTNATVSDPILIYLVPSRRKVAGDPVFIADNVVDLEVAWEGNSKLKVHAGSAHVYKRSGTAEIENGGNKVSIEFDIGPQQ